MKVHVYIPVLSLEEPAELQAQPASERRHKSGVTGLLKTADRHVSRTGLALVAMVMSSKPDWMNYPGGQQEAYVWGASATGVRAVPEGPDSDPLE